MYLEKDKDHLNFVSIKLLLTCLLDAPPEGWCSPLLSLLPLHLAFAQGEDILVYPLPLAELHRDTLRDLRFIQIMLQCRPYELTTGHLI